MGARRTSARSCVARRVTLRRCRASAGSDRWSRASTVGAERGDRRGRQRGNARGIGSGGRRTAALDKHLSRRTRARAARVPASVASPARFLRLRIRFIASRTRMWSASRCRPNTITSDTVVRAGSRRMERPKRTLQTLIGTRTEGRHAGWARRRRCSTLACAEWRPATRDVSAVRGLRRVGRPLGDPGREAHG